MTIFTQKKKKLIWSLVVLVFILGILKINFEKKNVTSLGINNQIETQRDVFKDEIIKKRISIYNKDFNITSYVAESVGEKTRGLSVFDSLDYNESMLFVFNNSDFHPFWMKDMNFPIDIIWLNEDKEIVFIKQNAKPKDFPKTYMPTKKNMYTIEFKEGFVSKNNLEIGDKFNW